MSKVNKQAVVMDSNVDSTSDMCKQTFKTRLSKDGEQFVTNATFDFAGVTVEQLQQLAIKTLVINAQAIYRAAGNVPHVDNIKVADMLVRERSTGGRAPSVATLVKNISKMSDADKAAMLALLTA